MIYIYKPRVEVYDEKEAARYIVIIIDYCGGEEWSYLEFYLGMRFSTSLYDFPMVNLEDDDNNQTWHDFL